MHAGRTKITAFAYSATVAGYRQTVPDSVREVEDALVLLAGLERESDLLDAAVQATALVNFIMEERSPRGRSPVIARTSVPST